MKHKLFLIFTIVSFLYSCKKFVQIDPPRDSMTPANVFKNDDLAISAVTGIYQQLASGGAFSGDASSISTICGVSADEFVGYSPDLINVSQNLITPEDSPSYTWWATLYARIYDINSILEGLKSSNDLTPSVKLQLQGETKFLRALHYFYLVNTFGPVPLHLTSDYKLNGLAKRAPEEEVYNQIIKDLTEAELSLNDNYVTTERVRPNKATVQALLARVYLYLKDWTNAEKYSSLIIEKSNTYKLSGINEVFLSNSLETIWQLMPRAGSNTPAGNILILTTVPTVVSLRQDFINQAFETNDQRKTAWVKSITVGSINYYYPFKYKVKTSTIVTEYYSIFRLAEQYLIRSEARLFRNNLSGAIDDLDAIRNRSGLLLIKNTNPGISKENLFLAILKERRVELFSEFGQRWYDLKRTGISTEILSPSKPNWKSEYILFPIPKTEINLNPNITPNFGY